MTGRSRGDDRSRDDVEGGGAMDETPGMTRETTPRTQPKGRTFDVINLAEYTPSSTQSSYLVKGFIHQRSVICLCGQSNHGKSMLAMRIALAVAGDLPIFGHGDPFGPVLTPGNVLYVGRQNGLDEDWRRLTRLARGAGLTHLRGLEPYGVHYADGLRYGTNFARTHGDRDHLMNVIEGIDNLRLIVFDPFMSLFGIDEEESGAYNTIIGIIEDQPPARGHWPEHHLHGKRPTRSGREEEARPAEPRPRRRPGPVISIKEEEPRNSGLFTVAMSKQRQGPIVGTPVKFRLIAKGPAASPVQYRISHGWGNPWTEADDQERPAAPAGPAPQEATKDRTRAAIAMLRLVAYHRTIPQRKEALDLLHQAAGASESTKSADPASRAEGVDHQGTAVPAPRDARPRRDDRAPHRRRKARQKGDPLR